MHRRPLALEIALNIIRLVRPLLRRIGRYDRELEYQIRKALTSGALNTGEAWKRFKRDRTHLYRVAAASEEEVRTGLLAAEAFGYLSEKDIAASVAEVDRYQRVVWNEIK